MKNILVLSLFLIASPLSKSEKPLFYVWNVGQGLWGTWIEPHFCLHFDMGGEKQPQHPELYHCKRKKNFALLSHRDWDHIRFVKSYYNQSRHFCLMGLPSSQKKSKEFLSSIPQCHFSFTTLKWIYVPSALRKKNENSLSRVVAWKTVLLPGDSTAQEERIWQFQAPAIIQLLILGHHGSRTSTSQGLLDQLPNLKQAVSSSRQRVYGHPHPHVVERLKKRGIPVLRTEIWGDLAFEL